MNRDRLLIVWPSVLIIGALVMETAYFVAKFSAGYSDYPAMYFALALMLIGLSALMTSSALIRVGTRIDQLERQLKASDGQQEALGESLRARVGKLEREMDELRAASGRQPTP